MNNMPNEIDYKNILNSMFEDLAIVDEFGKMIYVTSGFEKKYNIDKEKVIGYSMDYMEENDIFNPSVAKRVFETGETTIMSQRNNKGNYLIIKGVPIFDDGKIKYVVSFSMTGDEIQSLQTERDKLAEKLEEYQNALDDLQSYIKNGMNDLRGSKCALESINKIKAYDVSVLFTGESGVGKTTFARYLHENGSRCKGPFIEISCGAIPENLLESELFGYKKGSFTGADAAGKVGLIQMANNGTLFLDEIGELPLKLQSKLLKVLQSKSFTPVGATEEITVDFRLITATNKDLEKMVAEGTFREDLFYRINVITINIPPIKERPEDCLTLIRYFLKRFNLKYSVKKKIDKDCQTKMCRYSWPGNIREMENTIERMVLLADGDTITTDDLPAAILDELASDYTGDGNMSLPEQLKALEKKLILEALEKNKTTVGVAKSLGISQPTAARKIKEYTNELFNYE